MDQIIRKATAEDQTQRYASIAELRTAVLAALQVLAECRNAAGWILKSTTHIVQAGMGWCGDCLAGSSGHDRLPSMEQVRGAADRKWSDNSHRKPS